ncbi:hypothetical protein V8E53_002972 [Lactarius tabidus]
MFCDAVVVCDLEVSEPRNAYSAQATVVRYHRRPRVWVTHMRRLRGKELVEVLPSIRLAATAALSPKEFKRAASVLKAAITKLHPKRK